MLAVALLASSCTMIGWGWNEFGQVGGYADDANYLTPFASSPNVLSEGWTDVAPGSTHTCAVSKRGELWCWGANTYGQLGQGDHGCAWLPGQGGYGLQLEAGHVG